MEFSFNGEVANISTNYMDKWILSFTQSLVKFVTAEMTGIQITFTSSLVCINAFLFDSISF